MQTPEAPTLKQGPIYLFIHFLCFFEKLSLFVRKLLYTHTTIHASNLNEKTSDTARVEAVAPEQWATAEEKQATPAKKRATPEKKLATAQEEQATAAKKTSGASKKTILITFDPLSTGSVHLYAPPLHTRHAFVNYLGR